VSYDVQDPDVATRACRAGAVSFDHDHLCGRDDVRHLGEHTCVVCGDGFTMTTADMARCASLSQDPSRYTVRYPYGAVRPLTGPTRGGNGHRGVDPTLPHLDHIGVTAR
jgi:hypothetical protein